MEIILNTSKQRFCGIKKGTMRKGDGFLHRGFGEGDIITTV